MFKLLEKSLARGAECADIYYLERTEEVIGFENDKLKDIRSKALSGFTLRVKKDGHAGLVSSSNMSNTDEVLQLALESTKDGEILEYEFNRPQNMPTLAVTNDAIWERPFEEYVADGEKLVKLIKAYDPEMSVGVELSRSRETKSYLNTYGCDSITSRDTVAVAASGLLVQNQSMLSMYTFETSCANDYSIEMLAEKLIEKLKLGRVEKTMTGGKMPVILTPNAVAQIAFAMIMGLSGDTVRQGTSPLKGRLGEQIFSDKITLIDDMTAEDGLDAASFDDEGTPAERTVLFENGVLRNYLLDLRSAHKLGLEPNGKGIRRVRWFSRNYANAVTPWASNWIMQPGQHSLDDLLAEVKEGIMIDSMFGLVMGNLTAGAIDTDIDMAFKIENGKLVGRVKDAAVGFNIYEVLKNNVVALSDKQEHALNGSNSSMWMPHILLKDVNVTI